jgi:predicted methyltransferase
MQNPGWHSGVHRTRRNIIAVGLAVIGTGTITLSIAAPHEHAASHTFDDPAAYARAWENPDRDTWQRPEDLVHALGVKPAMAVADIGTGTGYLLPHLTRAVGPTGRVLAVDIAPEMLAWVEERAQRENLTQVETVVARDSVSGLPAASVDRAIMINVWHHIADHDAYARDLHRALREGGVLFIVEAHPDSTAPGGPPARYRMAPEAVIRQMQNAGFRASLDPFEIDRQYVIRAER